MAYSKSKIFCKKCMDIKGINRKYKAKDCHSRIPRKGITVRRKTRDNEKRNRFLHEQPSVRQDSESVIYLATRKRIREDSPDSFQSSCEKGACNRSSRKWCTSHMADKTPKTGILKRRVSATDIIEHYLNPDLDQVASSVEELSTCFDQKQGAFVPEKHKASVYQIAAPKTLDERKRSKKIRFEIPEGTLGYEDAKKAMWRKRKNDSVNIKGNIDRHMPLKAVPTRHPAAFRKNPRGSPAVSNRPVIPSVERLKEEDDVVENELDLRAITQYVKEDTEEMREGKGTFRWTPKKRKRMEKDYSNEKESENDCGYEFDRY